MSLKRLFTFLLGFFTLLACTACAPETAAVPFFGEEVFSLVAQGTICNFSAAWELSRDESGTVRMQFTSPESISGILYTVAPPAAPTDTPLFSVSGGDYTAHGIVASYDGVEIPLTEGSFPTAVMAMVQLFSFTQSEVGDVTRKGEETVAEFACSDGNATVHFSPEGAPLSAKGTLYGTDFSLTLSSFERRGAGECITNVQ